MSEQSKLDELAETTGKSSSQSWSDTNLGKVVSITGGKAFSSDQYVDDGVPLIRITNIGPGIPTGEDLKHLPKSLLENVDSKFILKEDDILMALSGATTGKVSRLSSKYTPALLNQRIAKFNTSGELNHHFLLFCLQSHNFQRYVDAFASGGAQDNISTYDLERISIPQPPISEQREIATVLYTVDRAIEKTEEIIERLSRIKKGFKQDVFAEGYFDHQSHQESQIGKIPESWRLESAADLCDGITVGVVTGATDSYVSSSEGVPFIRSQDVHENYIEQDSMKYISEEFHEQQNSSELREGDVITVRTGEPGTSCVIPPELDGSNCFSLIISRPKEEVNERFYSYYVNSEKALDFIDSWKAGGVQDNFNVGVMERLPVPVPAAEEQQAIVDSVDEINERLESERQYRNHLQRVKRGLMQDLLSGTVRTTDTNLEVPEEIAQYG